MITPSLILMASLSTAPLNNGQMTFEEDCLLSSESITECATQFLSAGIDYRPRIEDIIKRYLKQCGSQGVKTGVCAHHRSQDLAFFHFAIMAGRHESNRVCRERGCDSHNRSATS